MSLFLGQGARMLHSVLLAFMLVFAQQAAQLHALAHAEEQLAQPHKGKAATHPVERCIAFHAIGSALTASAGAQDFAAAPARCAVWFAAAASAFAHYRLPARAPPQAA